MILFLVIASMTCFLKYSAALDYFVSPDNSISGVCSVTAGGTALKPCYSLQQLSADDRLLFNKSMVTLHLLSGRHVLPDNYTPLLSDKSIVEISSWDQQGKETTIECHPRTQIKVLNVHMLHMESFNLSSCSFLLTSDINNFIINAFITKCVFTESRDYAISTYLNREVPVKVNISVEHCAFLFNNGVIISRSVSGHLPNISTFLRIKNTKFVRSNRTVIQGYKTDLEIYQCSFINNTGENGALGLSYSFALIQYSNFLNNYALQYGGAIYHFVTSLEIHHCSFRNNFSIMEGGAIYTELPQKFVIRHTHFKENYANTSGGAIYTEFVILQDSEFTNNYAADFGGAIHFYEDTDDIMANRRGETLIYNTTFYLNQAGAHGGAIYCNTPKKFIDIYFNDRGYSSMNTARLNGGFMYLLHCSVSVEGEYYIMGNKATNGGALYANNSKVFRNYIPKVTFVNNTAADFGGGIFAVGSKIKIFTGGEVFFENNMVISASGKGGAIYIEDSNCENILKAYKDCSIDYLNNNPGVKHIHFFNNSATYGPVLYGGLLDRCYHVDRRLKGIEYFKQVSEYEERHLAITSGPVKICFCLNSFQPDCAAKEITRRRVMRGGIFEIFVTPVDQDENPVPSVIRANYEKTTASLGEGEGRNKLTSNCSTLLYHIFSTDPSATLIIQPEGLCERSPLSSITITIELINCSLGFEQNIDRCVCDHRLTTYLNVTVCDVNKRSVQRQEAFWFNYDDEFLSMAKNCPLKYCKLPSNIISLSALDEQCVSNRSGILCGGCQENFSIVLGSSRCLQCTHTYYDVLWLVPVIALAGIALVAALLVCNMTISHGTLNGLVFYANVISIAGLMNIQNCSIHPVLSVFIAWANLELGVETCFYSGMDTYQKTWLQFAFPLYIWLLVGAIIVASYYSSTAMKLFGRNILAVLATLFILSYSKFLKTIITALRTTQVLVSDAGNVSAPVHPYRVWTYDGNLEYIKGKHAVLFAVALIFLLVLFLPYTLLLTFGQCIRSLALRKRWILRLIRSTAFVSFLDAYHAPYNSRHRYWTGLLLLTRCILFLAFTTSYGINEITVNSYITLLVTSMLVLIKTCSTKVYRNFWVNVLELCFLFNLELLSATLYYLKGANVGGNGAICKTVNASISVSFLVFIGIAIYHAFLRMQATKWYGIIKLTILSKLPLRRQQLVPLTDGKNLHTTTALAKNLPTSSFVDLREELLSSMDDH